jgi:hypothetical protein
MVYFQTKNPKLGKFWRVLQWKMLVYFMVYFTAIQFYGRFVYFVVIWFLFSVLVYCAKKNLAALFHIRSSVAINIL